jgi:Protein of unknown function (DUF3575)
MRSWLKYLLLAAGLFWFQCLHGQQAEKLPKPNLIKVGLMGMLGPDVFGTVAWERPIGSRNSFIASGGINPFISRHARGLYKFSYHLAVGFRQYLFLPRHVTCEGLYLGLELAIDRLKFYYKGQGGLAYRGVFNTVGLELGYQHTLGSRFCLELGITPAYPGSVTYEYYLRDGKLGSRNTFPVSLQIFVFCRVGLIR